MADRSLRFRLIGQDVSASKSLDKVGRKGDKVGRGIGTAFGIGLAAAAAGLAKLGASSVRAFVESEQSQARLSAAFEKFPTLADATRESFDKLNKSLATKTKFDDDALASGQAVLAQFKLTGKQLKAVTPLLADYAAKTGKDLSTAAGDLGKAFSGNARALKAIGINFKATGDRAKDFENLTALLRQQVGGFAEKEGTTAAGRAAILSNRWGEMKEAIGAKLLPALIKLGEWLSSIAGFVERNSAVIVPLVTILGSMAVAVWATSAAVSAATAVAAAFGTTLNLSLGPIALVAAAVVGIGVALVLAYKKSETFRAVVNTSLTAVTATFGKVRDAVGWVIDKLGFLGAAFTSGVSVVQAMATAVGAIAGAIQWVIDKVDALIGKLDFLPGVGGNSVSDFVKGFAADVGIKPQAAGAAVGSGGGYQVRDRSVIVVDRKVLGAVTSNESARRSDRNRGARVAIS